jgi:hypothetical protein
LDKINLSLTTGRCISVPFTVEQTGRITLCPGRCQSSSLTFQSQRSGNTRTGSVAGGVAFDNNILKISISIINVKLIIKKIKVRIDLFV